MKILCSVKLSPHRYKTPEGYLYCKDAIIARTGPQTYLKSEIIEGSDSDEYIDVDRSEEEVFSEKTMSSFEGKPLTIEHPSESVGPENYKDLSVGHIQNIRRGEYEGQPVMLADIIVNDAEAIDLIESGEMVELSCGYDCDITGGEHPEQINIRGNHVALCEQGRAGIARIQDSKWGAKALKDAVGKGSLIQEFGKQGKQYKISKIVGNVIYAASLLTGDIVLFKKDEENVEWATITKSEVKDSREDTKDPAVGYYVNGQHFEHKDGKEAYKLARELQEKGELKEFSEYWVDEMGYGHDVDMRKQIKDAEEHCSSIDDEFEQFNVFIDNMTLEEAKEYCRVYGVRGKKKPDGFVIFGARPNIENLLNDFIGEEKRIHRILEEGWYSTPDFEPEMMKALRLDEAPKYAVFVKKDGKWVVFGGNESGKVDERAFLKKYEGVKIVENKDLDKVKAELNNLKDEEIKHYIIALSGEKDKSTWLGEDDKPIDDFNKARKFNSYEEADSYRKTYCKGAIQSIRDAKLVDSKIEASEVEVVKKLISDVEYEEPIRYDQELKVIDIYFFDKKELRKAGKRLVSLYDLELDEDPDELCITLYEKFDKPMGIYLAEDSIRDEERWSGFDLKRGPASKEFKNYLRGMGFYFEPSENGDYVHFEVKNADKWVKQRADDIREHWAKFQDSYSKKFYVKAIKSLEDQLEKLEKNEILDENNEDYEVQKNKMRETIKEQIKQYKAKLENE